MSASTTTTGSKKIIKLQAGDEQTFEVPRDMAEMCKTVKDMLADLGETEDLIPLPNVTGPILAKVLEYVKYHFENPTPEDQEQQQSVAEAAAAAAAGRGDDDKPKKPKKSEPLKPWDQQFISVVDHDTLFSLMLASNYLDLKSLLDVCAKTVAALIKDKDADGIRKLFNLKPAFTPEEEAQLREQIDKIE